MNLLIIRTLVSILTMLPVFANYDIPPDQFTQRKGPDRKTVMQIQSDFLQLSRAPEYEIEVTRAWNIPRGLRGIPGATPVPNYRLILKGEAKVFTESHHPADIVFALKPFLRNLEHDAEACILINGILKEQSDSEFSTFRSRKNPGNWAEKKEEELDLASSGASSFYSQWMDMSTVDRSLMKYQIQAKDILPSSIKKRHK